MNKLLLATALGLTLFVSACATIEPIPVTRKLTAKTMVQLGQTDIIFGTNHEGIRAGWTSAGAAPATPGYYYVPPGTSPLAAGVGAGIGHAIGVAIVDAAPSARAKKNASKINTDIDKKSLDKAFIQKIKEAMVSGTVTVGEVSTAEFKRKDPVPQDKIKLISRYTLAEDASAIRVDATITYENDAISYKTPYDFDGKPPKKETKGPLYRNTFSYHSDRFEVPALTDEVKTTLVDAIRSQYDEDFTVVEDTKIDGKNQEKRLKKLLSRRNKALEQAEDGKFSKTEKAILLIDNWRGSGSPALNLAIEQGQLFIAQMLVLDINNASVPRYETAEPREKPGFFKGVSQGFGPLGNEDYSVLTTANDGRKVVRLDSGTLSGAYFSYPESGFSNYGNAYKIDK